MPKRILLICWFVGLPLYLGAQHIHRIVPEAPPGHVAMGREYIPLSNGPFELELGFDGFFEDYLVFDLVVHAADSFYTHLDLPSYRVDPADFYYLVLDDAQADSSILPAFSLTRPELILSQYDRFSRELEAARQASTGFTLLEAGLGILSSAGAFAATDDAAFLVDAVFRSVGAAGEVVGQQRAHRSALEGLAEEKSQMEGGLFQQVDLRPGQAAHGYLFFPMFDEPAHLMFCFPIEDRLFQFVYRQE